MRKLVFLSVLLLPLLVPGISLAGRSIDEVAKAASVSLASQVKDPKGRFAIGDIPYGRTEQAYPVAKYIGNNIGSEFINKGFTVVDRGHLEKIMKEQKIQNDALFDTKTAARVGKLAGASFFVFGRFYANYQWVRISLWIVDVQTGLIVAADEQTEPMTASFEADLNALVPGLAAVNSEVKRYRAQERLCQVIGPGMDLTDVAKLFNAYVPKDPEIRLDQAIYYTNILPAEVGGKAYDGTRYPSGWKFGKWFFSDSEGNYSNENKSNQKREDLEIKLAEQNRDSHKSLPAPFAEGKPSGIKIKSWAYLGPESFPSSPYCLPDGSAKVNNRVNADVRIPSDDGSSQTESVLTKLSKVVESKIFESIKNTSGTMAITSFGIGESDFPSAAVHVLEDRIMVAMVQHGFKVADRGTLEKIINEQKLQKGALFDPASLSKVGKLVGAQYVLIGSLERTPVRLLYSLRVANVSTGVFLAQAQADIKNNLALDEELSSMLSFTEFSYPLNDELLNTENFLPPSYMGENWRDNLKRQKYSLMSDWICSRVSPGGDVSAIIQEAHKRNLFTGNKSEIESMCSIANKDPKAQGYVLRLGSLYENKMRNTEGEWLFDVVQNPGDAFCTYDEEKKQIIFAKPLSMRAWKYEGPENLAPVEDNGFRENCLKEGFNQWNSQRRDKKKKIR